MKTWKAVAMGTGFGVALTICLGAIEMREGTRSVYLLMTQREIVNTAHIDQATRFVSTDSDGAKMHGIRIRYEMGSPEEILFENEGAANNGWDALKTTLHVAE